MGSVFFIEFMKNWLETNISSKIELKAPSNGLEDGGFVYTLKHPTIFCFNYQNDNSSPAQNLPSILFRIKKISLNNEKNDVFFEVEFILGCFCLGEHGRDIFTPSENSPFAYNQSTAKTFQHNQTEKNDLLNFIDVFLRAFRFFDEKQYIIDDKNFEFEIDDDLDIANSGLAFASVSIRFAEKRIIKQDETTAEKEENEKQQDFSTLL